MAAKTAKPQEQVPRPPSPLYRELHRKRRIYSGQNGILEIDFGSGLFGIEFPSASDNEADTELVRTNRRFPLAGVEKFHAPETHQVRRVFYFDASGSFARGSGELVFARSGARGRRVDCVRVRLEVE
jgi:hypothetical protein